MRLRFILCCIPHALNNTWYVDREQMHENCVTDYVSIFTLALKKLRDNQKLNCVGAVRPYVLPILTLCFN